MMDGNLIERNYPAQHYRTLFDQRSGFFVRKEDEGFPEPTWAAEGPELIDLSITSYCQKECSFCYRGANSNTYKHLSMKEVRSVIEQAAKCGTLQIALGGGNPNQHPEFVEILRLIRENGIVPSYTTNGDGLTDEVLQATAEYCGSMAVSIYPPFVESFYRQLIIDIASFGIKVNLHAILRIDYLDLWTKWLMKPPAFFEHVNAIIFLNYKPIGKDGVSPMPRNKEKAERFFWAANNCHAVKIGFDSCCLSGIVKWMSVPKELVESCEAARFSAFISEDMKMYPCSFMVEKGWCGDLRKSSLIDIWQNNEFFYKFRDNVQPKRCSGCQHIDICKGGCRLFEEINFCTHDKGILDK